MENEKLKTLKDIVNWTCKCGCVTFKGEICQNCKKPNDKFGDIDFEDLKQEIIKHLKKCKFCMFIFKRSGKYNPGICCNKLANFVNITEEDLKDGK